MRFDAARCRRLAPRLQGLHQLQQPSIRCDPQDSTQGASDPPGTHGQARYPMRWGCEPSHDGRQRRLGMGGVRAGIVRHQAGCHTARLPGGAAPLDPWPSSPQVCVCVCQGSVRASWISSRLVTVGRPVPCTVTRGGSSRGVRIASPLRVPLTIPAIPLTLPEPLHGVVSTRGDPTGPEGPVQQPQPRSLSCPPAPLPSGYLAVPSTSSRPRV